MRSGVNHRRNSLQADSQLTGTFVRDETAAGAKAVLDLA